MMPKSYTAEFQAFWDMYPRRVGKRTAFMTFEAAKKRATVTEIMRGAYEMQVQVDEGREMQFVPHPSTWLNRDGWEDEYVVSQTPPTPAEIGVQRAIEAHNAFIHRERAEARTKVDAGLSGSDEDMGREAIRCAGDAAAIAIDWKGREDS